MTTAQKMIVDPALSCRFQSDTVAERLKLTYMATQSTVTVSAVEIVRAKFVIGDAVAHHVKGDFEDLVPHGKNGFLMASVPLDAIVTTLQCGVFGTRGGQSRLDQQGAQIRIPPAGLTGPALAGALILSWTRGGPTTQMAGGGEVGHVTARFCHDGDRAFTVHSRNRVQLRQHRYRKGRPNGQWPPSVGRSLHPENRFWSDLADEKAMM